MITLPEGVFIAHGTDDPELIPNVSSMLFAYSFQVLNGFILIGEPPGHLCNEFIDAHGWIPKMIGIADRYAFDECYFMSG